MGRAESPVQVASSGYPSFVRASAGDPKHIAPIARPAAIDFAKLFMRNAPNDFMVLLREVALGARAARHRHGPAPLLPAVVRVCAKTGAIALIEQLGSAALSVK